MKRSICFFGVMLALTPSLVFAGNSFSCIEREAGYNQSRHTKTNFKSGSQTPLISQDINPYSRRERVKSGIALTELHQAYAEYREIDPEQVTEEDAFAFIRKTDKILLQHRELIDVAKTYWTNERSFKYKPLFAAIVYIADKNNTCLMSLKMHHVSDEKIEEMDAIRDELIDEIMNSTG